jgi:glycosyltransferase involved in cell wall biosynthesis
LAEAGYEVHYILPYEDELNSDFLTFHPYKPGTGRGDRFLHHGFRVLRQLDHIGRPGIVHFHDPDLMLLVPTLKKRGHNVIFDVHEEYVKQMSHRHWVPRSLRSRMGQVYQWLEDQFLPQVDAIIAATPAIARCYPDYHTVLVQNFPRQQYQHDFDYESYRERQAEVLYYGVINEVRGVEVILDAIHKLNEQGNKVDFRLAGAFMPESYQQKLEATEGWQYTKFLGYLDQAGIYRELKRARVAAVVIDAVPNHMEAQPNKLFEYMSAGLPIIYSNFPHWQSLIDGCGMPVEPENPEAIGEAIKYLLDHPQEAFEMGAQGRRAVHEYYNWGNEEKSLLMLYEQLNQTR